MVGIDQMQFHFSPRTGLVVALMVGFLVFAVALDLTVAQFRRVFARPVVAAVGLAAQFVILPAVAFLVGLLIADTPSVAIGLLLVACCPGGALSNYLTGVSRGDVATSISMTAVSTLASVVMTPLLFALWASLNPETAAVLRSIDIDARRIALIMLIMFVAPVTAGMLIRARTPRLAESIRSWVGRMAMVVFGAMVALVVGSNLRSIFGHGITALVPVLSTFTIASALGLLLARLTGLDASAQRAVVFEVGVQNAALAIALAVAFFPSRAGVAVTSALWGVVHVTLGFALAAAWRRVPIASAKHWQVAAVVGVLTLGCQPSEETASPRLLSPTPDGIAQDAGEVGEDSAPSTSQSPLVRVLPERAVLIPHEILRLEAQCLAHGQPSGGADSWSSSDPCVATVDANGIVECREPGATTIRFQRRGATAEAYIEVRDALLSGMSIVARDPVLQAARAGELIAVAEFSNGMARDVSDLVVWESAEPRVVEIEPNGTITARAVGSSRISASWRGVRATFDILVRP
jgi:BASS family bile acid:Na+ symporter